jgi:hypothetical protein
LFLLVVIARKKKKAQSNFMMQAKQIKTTSKVSCLIAEAAHEKRNKTSPTTLVTVQLKSD